MIKKLGLIGGGVMGEAILSRLITREIYAAGEIIVSEPQTTRQNFLTQKYGVTTCEDNQQVLSESTEIILLAVKPQVFGAISQDLSETGNLKNHPVIISIMAGVALKQLELAFPHQPIIRAMPNTPATIGAGITAMCAGSYANPQHIQLAKVLLQAVGDVVEVSEHLMDAVTGLSGSGPAYVALLIEALADGGVAAGLPRAIANQLALQTVLGTAELLKESKLHPAELKDRVTSPGGTTIAGIAQLEKAGFRSALIEAVKAATARSQELGKG
ncbi:pyrroline-5-carboxylate reductase [Calothrix sp. 336/3]|uniref:pyrroline-5-carboxylate reductase n=1 Tax=Calothrix sp. 336/3 TaxID=1337936 RepID=UPI0004E3C916|nr:pyrroline-5-carboxylate reductase [Calothrix sp. 336/3]AKG24643.1 Pyrroline-5-carboxylate reductase [Calothrix sp. 336/3]